MRAGGKFYISPLGLISRSRKGLGIDREDAAEDGGFIACEEHIEALTGEPDDARALAFTWRRADLFEGMEPVPVPGWRLLEFDLIGSGDRAGCSCPECSRALYIYGEHFCRDGVTEFFGAANPGDAFYIKHEVVL